MERISDYPLAISVKEAINLMCIGKTKFYELISDGKVSTVRVGRRRLIIYASLKAFLEKGEAK